MAALKKSEPAHGVVWRGAAYIIVPEPAEANSGSLGSVDGDMMSDEPTDRRGWSAAERQALRKLFHMALILLLAIVIAGAIAALLSSALGTV